MEITLNFLKSVYLLSRAICHLNYGSDFYWDEVKVIDQKLINDCMAEIAEALESGNISAVECSNYSETIKNMQEVLLGATFKHTEDGMCRNDYSWIDFRTAITLSNGKKYLLSGKFCPADGYDFQTLKEITT